MIVPVAITSLANASPENLTWIVSLFSTSLSPIVEIFTVAVFCPFRKVMAPAELRKSSPFVADPVDKVW